MVVVLGGLTIWLHNETFIKIKPTIYYLFVAGLLGFGLATGRPLLKAVLGSAYPGPGRRGLAQADPQLGAVFRGHGGGQRSGVAQLARPISGSASNCGARSPLTFLFAVANVPMLMRHGLTERRGRSSRAEPGPVE